jgi:hypothetical protein
LTARFKQIKIEFDQNSFSQKIEICNDQERIQQTFVCLLSFIVRFFQKGNLSIKLGAPKQPETPNKEFKFQSGQIILEFSDTEIKQ